MPTNSPAWISKIAIMVFALAWTFNAGGQSIQPNPTADFYNDPVWKERFIGSYGVLSGREPKISAEDRDILQAVQAYLPDDMDRAISTLESAIVPQSSPALYFILGNFYFQNGNLEKAKANYETAISAFPDFLRAHKNLGLLAFQDGNYEVAQKTLNTSIALGDTDGRTYGMLGYCLQNTDKFLSAESAYRLALMAEPDNKDWKILLAQSLLAQEKNREAHSLFSELMVDSPDDVTFWLAQANSYLGLGEPERAATNFEIVRRMGKATAESLHLLGDIYMNKQILDLALEAYLEAIDMDPKQSPKSPLRAAETMTNYGAYDEASTLIGKIEDVYNDRLEEATELKLLTLKAQIALSTGKGEEAALALEEILKRDPLNHRALLTLGDYYGRNNMVEKAVLLYERAEELEDNIKYQALIRHGQLMVKEKRWVQGVDLLRRALEIEKKQNVEDYLMQVVRVARASGVEI